MASDSDSERTVPREESDSAMSELDEDGDEEVVEAPVAAPRVKAPVKLTEQALTIVALWTNDHGPPSPTSDQEPPSPDHPKPLPVDSRGKPLPIQQDHGEAARWFRLAADQGHAEAQLALGKCYSEGKGVGQNDDEGARWWRLAADQGQMDAQLSLGKCHQDGRGVTHDDDEGARWFRLAADKGHAGAQLALAKAYHDGKGVAQSDEEAASLWRLAADQGNMDGQCFLGWCYAEGRGVPKNDRESARWRRLAADQGHAPAYLALGAVLIEGIPDAVPADPCKGANLLALYAQTEIGEFGASGLNPALEVLRSHADNRDVVASCCIGCGATRGLKQCTRCHVARFCGSECVRKVWPAHKGKCKQWGAAAAAAAATAAATAEANAVIEPGAILGLAPGRTPNPA